MSQAPFPEPLQSWAESHFSEQQWDRLEKFHTILLENASKMSLISKADIPNIWGRHIADSLTAGALGKLSNHGKWVDLGCGAGLPLIPLAIAFPEWEFTGIDTRGLRIELLLSAVAKLGLRNVKLFRGNAKVLGNLAANHERYDIASTRAVGKIPQDAAMAFPFLQRGGAFLTFKGSEHAERIDGYEAPTYTPYRLSGVDNELHIVRAIKL
jgi:16S rRNA (guanine527-N7)-methyltransferase